MRIFFSFYMISVFSLCAFGGYTTPNTGIQWNLDSLVAHSGGTLSGTFPSYTLNDTITIATTDRLTIQPGSLITVTQGAGKGFTVFGVLRAIGTMRDSIIVKGSVDSAGWHRGFRFEDSSVDSQCIVSYCRIMNATEGIHCLNSNPVIQFSLFTRNSSNGVRCFGASPIVYSCLFTENRQSAITANSSSSPEIFGNIFARNNSQNTGARNAIAVGGQGANNPIIRSNEIYNQDYFRAGAISLVTLTSSDVCNAIVENNYLHDNSFGIVVQGLTAGGTLRPIIRNNLIENNRINPDPLVSGSGITMQAGGPSNAPIITGNIIKGNYWGITCVSSTGLTNSPRPNLGDLSNADTNDDGWNIFENNNNGGVIYQLYNNGTQDISAQNNYWGTTDSTTLERWIVHRADSSVFGRVNYMPRGQPGLGQADSFVVRRISPTQIQLRWSFPFRWPPSTLRLDYSTGSPIFTFVASLPDTQRSYVMTIPNTPSGYLIFRLRVINRFGITSNTTRFIVTNVRELREVPAEFSLEQNYPNPFNPSTKIKFAIPEQRVVSLKVFDAVGREVAILVSEKLHAGIYEVAFEAADLASGVYFYRLQAGNFFSTRKLLLQK